MPSTWNTVKHQRSLVTKVDASLNSLQLYNESPWDVVVTIQCTGKGDTVTTTNSEARQLGATTPPVPTRKFIIH